MPTLGLALELTQKSCQPLNGSKSGSNPAMTQGSDAQRLIFDKVGLEFDGNRSAKRRASAGSRRMAATLSVRLSLAEQAEGPGP
jgi:hypothetical protein